MSVFGEPLFSGRLRHDRATLSDVLAHVLDRGVKAEIEAIPAAKFATLSDEQVVSEIAGKLRIKPLRLDREAGSGTVTETQMAVRDVFGGTANVKGLRVIQSVPYTGDPALWELRPNQYDFSPPYGKVWTKTIEVGIEVRESEQDRAVEHIKSNLDSIQTYIGRQEQALTEFNARLESTILPLVTSRRAILQNANDLSSRLKGL